MEVRVVRPLLAAGAEINTQDRDGWTALMWAAVRGHDGCVRELMKAGANVNVKSEDGKTAEDLARSRGNKETAGLIEG